MLDAEQAVDQARLLMETAEAQLQVTLIGPRSEAIKEAEGKIKTADGAVAFSKAHLNYHTIRSPIDGVLDSLVCHPGQTIAIGANIGEVVDTRQVFATIWLGPRAASNVKVGQIAKVRSADLGSEDDKGELTGKVAFVGRVADAQTGNLPVHVAVDNPDGKLTLGESVAASIEIDTLKDVVQVPAAAVFDLGEGPILNVVRDGKNVTLHPKVAPPAATKSPSPTSTSKTANPSSSTADTTSPKKPPSKSPNPKRKKATRKTTTKRPTPRKMTTRRPTPKKTTTRRPTIRKTPTRKPRRRARRNRSERDA